jgi:hypothetical protein
VRAFAALVQRHVAVFAQQAEVRQRMRLARLPAAPQEVRQFAGIAISGIQPLAPVVGDGGEMAVKGFAPPGQGRGQPGREMACLPLMPAL